jgi:DHA2 family multidrug resistance protein-like MFS transporter
VQETAYELGITVGVSVLGSLALARYRADLALPTGIADPVAATVRDGLPQATAVAADRPELLAAAVAAFEASFTATLTTAALVSAVLAVLALLLLPRDRASVAVDSH